MTFDVAGSLWRNAVRRRRLEMSALPSQLTISQVRALRAGPTGKSYPVQPSAILRVIGNQVRALFLAQRTLHGRFAHAADAAEDDYRRFSSRSY
jgi:hypothetical protein